MKKDNPYTLISYKCDSVDTCMGCHMASYSSNFKFMNNLSREDLITEFSKLIFYNLAKLDTNEEGYIFIILRDGICIFSTEDNGYKDSINDNNICFDLDDLRDYWDDKSDDYIEKEDEFKTDMSGIISETLIKVDKLVSEENRRIEEEEKKKKERLDADKLEQEKRLYENLKKKFGE